nr:hypothetical protein [Salinigranum salinum]
MLEAGRNLGERTPCVRRLANLFDPDSGVIETRSASENIFCRGDPVVVWTAGEPLDARVEFIKRVVSSLSGRGDLGRHVQREPPHLWTPWRVALDDEATVVALKRTKYVGLDLDRVSDFVTTRVCWVVPSRTDDDIRAVSPDRIPDREVVFGGHLAREFTRSVCPSRRPVGGANRRPVIPERHLVKRSIGNLEPFLVVVVVLRKPRWAFPGEVRHADEPAVLRPGRDDPLGVDAVGYQSRDSVVVH